MPETSRPRLSAWKIFKLTYGFISQHYLVLLKQTSALLVLGGIIFYLIPINHWLAIVMFYTIAIYLMIKILISTHAQIIIGKNSNWREFFLPSLKDLKYFGVLFVLNFIQKISDIIEKNLQISDEIIPILLILLLSIISAYILIRFIFTPAIVAIEAEEGSAFAASWKLTNGLAFQIFLSLLLIVIPFIVIITFGFWFMGAQMGSMADKPYFIQYFYLFGFFLYFFGHLIAFIAASFMYSGLVSSKSS